MKRISLALVLLLVFCLLSVGAAKPALDIESLSIQQRFALARKLVKSINQELRSGSPNSPCCPVDYCEEERTYAADAASVAAAAGDDYAEALDDYNAAQQLLVDCEAANGM